MGLFGIDMFGNEIQPNHKCVLAKEFIEPPFSVLNTENQRWRVRKKAWLNLGIQSELGREITTNQTQHDNNVWQGNNITTSVFDPVLCEIIYRWFSATDKKILDPFAGGSVRGIVASHMHLEYYGYDLNRKQIHANRKQMNICNQKYKPDWLCGDSDYELSRFNYPMFDFLFTCPPYGNLEVYSDDPRDLSTMKYPEFIDKYNSIISKSIALLKGEYAVIVVSNFRDKQGYYHNFVGDTITIFEDNGMRLYNDIILINPGGSSHLRARKIFTNNKKVVKKHQNVLVFRKFKEE